MFTSTVNEYILNGQWHLPSQFIQSFPDIAQLIQNVPIPISSKIDQLMWKHSDTGDLLLKEAYIFKNQEFQDLQWPMFIWCKEIPPARSLFVWRFMHNKVPTDENLMLRGCNIPSMCNLCLHSSETDFHLFFKCPYATKLWNWLANILQLSFNFSSKEDIWNLCDKAWSPQCKIVVKAALVNLINIIWHARNQARFNSKQIHWKSALSMLIASTSLSGNNTSKVSNNSIVDFTILKTFSCVIHNPKAPMIKEVLWNPPQVNWLKCNIDGASSGNPGISACRGIFRNHNSDAIFLFFRSYWY